MKKNYHYNYDFLEQWRIAHHVGKSELMDVMDAHSRNNLDEWLGVSKEQREALERGEEPIRKPLSLKHILRLCNHYGIELMDFFLEDDQPIKKPQTSRSRVQNDTFKREEVLEMKVHYYEQLEKIRLTYDDRLSDVLDRLKEKEKTISDLQQTILHQQTLIMKQQDALAKHQEHLAVSSPSSYGTMVSDRVVKKGED